eukprot:GHVR01016976.1.p1 GENE.GHVR01016976.1~~GHVR01016976.1.p1  ORF type:complete len:186 (-),score=41.00 GHVR01016976.1:695-1252(-)
MWNILICDIYINIYISFRLIPAGNVVFDGDSVNCQHGEDECALNRVHLCGIAHIPSDQPLQLFKFISCVAAKASIDKWRVCPSGGRTDVIDKCAFGDEGKELLESAAKSTLSLEPSHEYVPWVLIDNKHRVTGENDLIYSICKQLEWDSSNYKACDDYLSRNSGGTTVFRRLISNDMGRCNRLSE